MKSILKLLLAISLIAGCTVAPTEPADINLPSSSADALGTAVPASFYAARSSPVTTGYVAVPGGLQVHKSCVQLLKPGEVQQKRSPCPYAPIKGKVIKQTIPVQPNTLITEPAASFEEVPGTWIAANITDYHSSPNYGWTSQYNITGYYQNSSVPLHPTGGDQGQLIYIGETVQKWGGNYPQLTTKYATAGAFLQWGYNGYWGGNTWAVFTFASDQYGNWTFNGPIYDVSSVYGIRYVGSSSHVNDPYWGSVTRWHLSINIGSQTGLIPLDFNYPDPWDFNFVGSTLEYVWGPAQAVNLYPDTSVIGFNGRLYTQPHGCTPGDDEYPAPAWLCTDSNTVPQWQALGNGGTMSDYYWKGTPPHGVGIPYASQLERFHR